MTNAVGDIVTVMVTNEREIKEKEKNKGAKNDQFTYSPFALADNQIHFDQNRA